MPILPATARQYAACASYLRAAIADLKLADHHMDGSDESVTAVITRLTHETAVVEAACACARDAAEIRDNPPKAVGTATLDVVHTPGTLRAPTADACADFLGDYHAPGTDRALDPSTVAALQAVIDGADKLKTKAAGQS